MGPAGPREAVPFYSIKLNNPMVSTPVHVPHMVECFAPTDPPPHRPILHSTDRQHKTKKMSPAAGQSFRLSVEMNPPVMEPTDRSTPHCTDRSSFTDRTARSEEKRRRTEAKQDYSDGF